MAKNQFSVKVPLPVDKLWKMLRRMDDWLPQIPGYIHHDTLNPRERILHFKNRKAFVPMEHHVKITFLNWQEPKRLKVHVKDIKGNWMGYGVIETKQLDPQSTLASGVLEVRGRGAAGKMVEAYFSKNLSELAEEWMDSILDEWGSDFFR